MCTLTRIESDDSRDRRKNEYLRIKKNNIKSRNTTISHLFTRDAIVGGIVVEVGEITTKPIIYNTRPTERATAAKAIKRTEEEKNKAKSTK